MPATAQTTTTRTARTRSTRRTTRRTAPPTLTRSRGTQLSRDAKQLTDAVSAAYSDFVNSPALQQPAAHCVVLTLAAQRLHTSGATLEDALRAAAAGFGVELTNIYLDAAFARQS